MRWLAKLFKQDGNERIIANRYRIGEVVHCVHNFHAVYRGYDDQFDREVMVGTAIGNNAKNLGELCKIFPVGKCYDINLERPYELEVQHRLIEEDTGYVVMEKKKRVVKQYELLYERDKGSMGIIYKAKDVTTGHIFALKELGNTDTATQAHQRMLQESNILQNLSHKYILKVYETFTWRGKLYLIMDYITGQNLADLIERGPIPPKFAIQCLQKVAQALSYIHNSGIIHRDIKPSNIMLDTKLEPKLMDFGIAKMLRGQNQSKDGPSEEGISRITLSGQVVGTPRYMAPEVIKIYSKPNADNKLDRRVDVFALGVTLAEMLLGYYPFSKKDNHLYVFWSILNDPTPQLPADSDINCAINSLLQGMIAKEVDDRTPDMETVVDRMESILKIPKPKSSIDTPPALESEGLPKPEKGIKRFLQWLKMSLMTLAWF